MASPSSCLKAVPKQHTRAFWPEQEGKMNQTRIISLSEAGEILLGAGVSEDYCRQLLGRIEPGKHGFIDEEWLLAQITTKRGAIYDSAKTSLVEEFVLF